MKKLIKRVFNKVGLDICKISKSDKNRFDWLSNLNINTVFDIGANIGSYTSVFLQAGAKVVAAEPVPLCVDKLSK